MNKGFSIVQVLISIGLFAIIIVSGFKIFEGQTRLGKSSSFVFESLVVLDEVKSILSSNSSCRATLKGKSAFYDEIENILSFDPQLAKTNVEYQVFLDQKNPERLYGQKNVLIKGIEVLGDKPGFESENGFFLLRMAFQEYRGSGKFTGEFPVRVKINELGRIVDCQAREGLHGTGSAREMKGLWQRVKTPNGGLNSYYDAGKVVIGNIRKASQLNVEGGIMATLPKLESGCEEKLKGSLVYEQERDSLFWCDGQFWRNISEEIKYNKKGDEITLEGQGSQLKSEALEKKYSYCILKEVLGNQGECRAQSVGEKKWELLLKGTPGFALRCVFTCF